MNTRLQQFLAAENITQAQLADSLNVARAGVSHIIAGRNKPSYDFLTALLNRFPRLNIEWLMFGKGKMYKDLPETIKTADNRQDSDLLFNDDYDLFEDPVSPASEANSGPAVDKENLNKKILSDINNTNTTIQNTVHQRNVKKILILFDDGTFQEM
jgi:transcriptional regulator with XRE-family HTH domain